MCDGEKVRTMNGSNGEAVKNTNGKSEHVRPENDWRDTILQPAIRGFFAVVMTMILVGGGAVLAIKLCLWAALSEQESQLLKEFIPLLEKLVWPLFTLILVLMFWKKAEEAVCEIPGVLKRSSFDLQNFLECFLKIPYLEPSSSKKTDTHKRAVGKIIELLKRDEGIEIDELAKSSDSRTIYNGVYIVGRTPCCVAIVPRERIDLLKDTVNWVNSLFQLWSALRKKSIRDMVLICCVYGFENQAQIEKELSVSPLRLQAHYKLIFRCFTRTQLSDGDSKE